jgi:hypothetical protein
MLAEIFRQLAGSSSFSCNNIDVRSRGRAALAVLLSRSAGEKKIKHGRCFCFQLTGRTNADALKITAMSSGRLLTRRFEIRPVITHTRDVSRPAQIEMGISLCEEARGINHADEFPRKVDISDRNLYRTRGRATCSSHRASICLTRIIYAVVIVVVVVVVVFGEYFRHKWIVPCDKHCDTLALVN